MLVLMRRFRLRRQSRQRAADFNHTRFEQNKTHQTAFISVEFYCPTLPLEPPDESCAKVNLSNIGNVNDGHEATMTRPPEAPGVAEALRALAREAQRPMHSLSPRPYFFKLRIMSKQRTEGSGLGRKPKQREVTQAEN